VRWGIVDPGAGWGAVARLGDEGELGRDGAEKPRDPRLPPEDPPPARAQAVSPVRTGVESTSSPAVVVPNMSAIVNAAS
jgi:hypothetical protein